LLWIKGSLFSAIFCYLSLYSELEMQAKYKLAVRDHLGKSEFPISLFEFESNDRFRIFLSNTELKFEIEQSPKDFNSFQIYYNQYKPDYPLLGPIGSNYKISNIFEHLDYWLKTAIEPYLNEVQSSELWRSFETRSLFNGVFDSDQNFENSDDYSYLTVSEVQHLKNAVSQIKYEIQNEFQISNSLAKVINSKLDYLIESTDRLNKFDIKGTLLNTFLSIGINLGVDTESGKILYVIFKDAFSAAPFLYEVAKAFLQSYLDK
jgi:hypothetical protein